MEEYILFALIILVLIFITLFRTEAFGHRDGCHRWHSCPSDSGNYVCGDLGYDSEC
jgi:hypothetical protein